MVKRLHRAGIEVILDVVYNHTGEGNHLGPTLSLRGIDNAAYYRLVPDEPALLRRLHRLRQQPQHAAPAYHPADHGQPALLGAGDARRRLPLRPRPDAGARALRGEPPRHLLRHHPPGPGALAGEAHRRAVGHRPGRLSGRATSRPGGRSGTASTATRVRRFWRGDAGQVARARVAPLRQQRPLRVERAAARTPASTSSPPRRLHAARPRQLRAQAQRGERRGQPRRHRRQPEPQLGRRGPDGRRRRSSRCATQIARNFLATLAFSQGVPMLTAGDEVGRTQRGNNNAYARTTSSAGSTGSSTTGDAARVHAPGVRDPRARIRCCAGGASSAAARSPRAASRT